MRQMTSSGDAYRRSLAAVVFTAFAFLPLFPAISLLALGSLLIALAVVGRWSRADIDVPVAILAITVAGIGSLAQLANWASPPVPPALAAAPLPVTTAGDRNLLAAHDVSWLRPWTRDGGLGAYATPVDGAFWRLPAIEPTTGSQVHEVLSALEVRIAADTGYVVSVVLRHDGTWVDATLYERTREGRRRLLTTSERLGPNLVRLSAAIAPRETPARLRSLHLVDLGGDWDHLDVGWPSLTEGAGAVAYAPRASEPPWLSGIAWWLGLGAVWVLLPVAARAIVRLDAGTWISRGLLAGLAAQAFLAVGQIITAGTAAPRAAGSLMEPNLLAHVALIAALTATAVARRPLRVGPLAALLAIVIIAASGSRTAILGLALGAAALSATLTHRYLRRRALALSAGLLVVGVVVAAAVLGARSDGPWGEDPNVRARCQVWQASSQIAADRPLLGVGHERLALFYEFWRPPEEGPIYRNTHAHNAWLALAAGFGWPTAVAFGVLLLASLWRSPRPGPAAVVLGAALTVNLVDLTFFHPAFFVPLWTALTLPPRSQAA